MDPQKRIIIGELGKPFGVQGWIKVRSFTDPPDNIFQYSPWLLSKLNYSSVEVEAFERKGEKLLVKLIGYDTPEHAGALTLSKIAIYRHQLPALTAGEYYQSDLEGLQVYNQEGIYLGKIDHLFPTGANDVIVVKGEKLHLIPYVPEHYVVKIALEENTMIVKWDPNF